jgi:hypothetical protein
MKVSEITINELSGYLRLEETDLTAADIQLLDTLLTVAKSFVKGQTALTDEELDDHDDLVIAVYVLVQDMFDNRTLYVDKTNMNKVVEAILGMHKVNLL